MHTSFATAQTSAAGASHHGPAPRQGDCPTPPAHGEGEWGIARQFSDMQKAFRTHGGLARVQDLMAMPKRADGANLATLARWIVNREIVCFDWQDETWFPMFQLETGQLLLKPALRTVLAELSSVFDHWDIANWFARPNPWLDHSSPVETFATNMPAVLYAARTERFIANG